MTNELYDKIIDYSDVFCQDLDYSELKSIIDNNGVDGAEEFLKEEFEMSDTKVEITEEMIEFFNKEVVSSAEYILQDYKEELRSQLEVAIEDTIRNIDDDGILDAKDIAYVLTNEAASYLRPDY